MKRLNGIKLNPIETWAHEDVTSWHSLTLALEETTQTRYESP